MVREFSQPIRRKRGDHVQCSTFGSNPGVTDLSRWFQPPCYTALKLTGAPSLANLMSGSRHAGTFFVPRGPICPNYDRYRKKIIDELGTVAVQSPRVGSRGFWYSGTPPDFGDFRCPLLSHVDSNHHGFARTISRPHKLDLDEVGSGQMGTGISVLGSRVGSTQLVNIWQRIEEDLQPCKDRRKRAKLDRTIQMHTKVVLWTGS